MDQSNPAFGLEQIGPTSDRCSIGPMTDGLLAKDRQHPEMLQHRGTRSYLSALAKVADLLDLVGAVAEQLTWQLFAYMLLAARSYDT